MQADTADTAASANKSGAARSFEIGAICIFSYITSYFMRHILSVSTPEMLETGLYGKEFLGSLSSTYMIMYAAGQLINGRIGDKVASKYMVLSGLALCGGASCAFPFATSAVLGYLLFAVMGFSLSMLRGPLVKTISENMEHMHARICNVFLSFAGFAGPLIASVISMATGEWKRTFIAAGILSAAIGVAAFILLSRLEARGAIKRTVRTEEKTSLFGGFAKVFKQDDFIFYMIISVIVEVSSASINFWLPTYLTERLDYEANTSKMIFSVIAFIRAFMPFLSLALIRLFREDGVKMAGVCSFTSAAFFLLAAIFGNSCANVVLLTLALMSISLMSSLVWTIYIPSLGKSGVVSTANGVLDFSGYFFASAANVLFAVAVKPFGWGGVAVIWALIAFVGVVSSVVVKASRR